VISGNITNFTFFDEIALILCFQGNTVCVRILQQIWKIC